MTSARRAWLEITRLSNLPTVLSGVVVIIAMRWTHGYVPGGLWLLPAMLVAMACLYAAGFILNDVFDREVDRIERPGRPIPSGRVRLGSAIRVAILAIIGGLVVIAHADGVMLGLVIQNAAPWGLLSGAVLVALILLYDRFHLASSWSVLIMGGCRSMVYMTCLLVALGSVDGLRTIWSAYSSSFAMMGMPVLPYLIAIGLYVAGFSRIARGEVAPVTGGLFCHHCGHPARKGLGTCTECGGDLDPERLERSTAPPLHRGLESLCISATFLPSAILLGLSTFQCGQLLWLAREVTPEEFATYFTQPLGGLASSMVIGVLGVVWLAVAAIRYRADRTRPTRSILMWLAAIPLLDGNLAMLMYLPLWAPLACFGLFVLTVLGHRRIMGT